MGAVGRLGLAIVGRSIGGPWGGLVGALVGSLLFPDKTPDQHSEGPRLQDLSITTSTYGTGVPWVWGQYLVPGNVIWVGRTTEHAKTTSEDVGGKGGGGSEYSYTEYSYTTSIAVGLCKGPMHKIVKIFLDNQLVYDALGNTLQKEVPGLRWRFYRGDEDQLPDSIIEAKEGIGNVPAFRGLCYVVFDELNITEFGNRIPSLQFVVQDSGVDSYIDLPLSQTIAKQPEFFVDLNRALKYHTDGKVLETVDLHTQRTSLASPVPQTEEGWPYVNIVGILPSGNLVLMAEGPQSFVTTRRRLGIVSASTHALIEESSQTDTFLFDRMAESAAVGQYMSLDGTTKRTVVMMGMRSIKIVAYGRYVAGYEISTGLRLLPFSSEPVTNQNHTYLHSFFTLYKQSQQSVQMFWLHQGVNSEGIQVLNRIVLSLVTVSDIAVGISTFVPTVSITDLAEYSVTDFDPTGELDSFLPAQGFADDGGPSGSFVDGLLYDESSDTAIITVMEKRYIIKINSKGDILWRTTTKANKQTFGFFTWRDGTLTNNSTLAVEYGGGLGYATQIIDLNTGKEIKNVVFGIDDMPSRFTTNAYSAYGIFSVYPDRIRLLDQAGPGQIPVSKIIQDVSNAVHQPNNDYSSIEDLYVLGYASAKPTDGRSIIDPLTSAFNFDGVDAGGFMRWIKRGQSAVAVVKHDDMITIDADTGSVLNEIRAEEVELPQAVGITYADADRNYESSVLYRQRYVGNEGYQTVRSHNQVVVELPAAVPADIIKQAADVILMSLWNGRTTQKTRLPPWSILFDPGDVVTLELPGLFPKDVRIGKQTVGADLVVEIESSSQDSSQYFSMVAADNGHGYEQPVLPHEQFTILYLLPTPYLTDEADTGRLRLTTYHAMGALRDGWTSGTLQRKPGDAPWISINALSHAAAHGSIIEVLQPSDPAMVFSFQPRASMRVRLVSGDLQSTTYEQLMEGANALVILHNSFEAEVVQFLRATLEEDGSYTLSGLLRGRRGTDYWACSLIARAGTAIVAVNTQVIGAVSEPLANLGKSQLYRAYGANQLPENGDEQSAILSGNELKPYAPVHPTLIWDDISGDITVTWERRSRIRGELRNLTGDVPLEEDALAFEIDVVGDKNEILRTISTQNMSFIYSREDQIEDDFQRGMQFAVYQLSAQVGRGFPLIIQTPGTQIDVAQVAALAITNVPQPDFEVSQANTMVVRFAKPSVLVAQMNCIIFGPIVPNTEGDFEGAQFSQLAVTDVLPSSWEGAQYNLLIIRKN